jgi:hypothetical protein
MFLILTDLEYKPTVNDQQYIETIVDSQNNNNINLGLVVYSTSAININQKNAKIYSDLANKNRGLFLSYSLIYQP